MFAPRHTRRQVPGSLAPMAEPQNARPPYRGLFGEKYQAPKANWADKLAVVGGMMGDLAQGGGTANTQAAADQWRSYVEQTQAKFEEDRVKKIRQAAALGDPRAMAYLDPLKNREFLFNEEQAGIKNTQTDRGLDLREQGLDQTGAYQEGQLGLGRDRLAEDNRHNTAMEGLGQARIDAAADAENGPDATSEGVIRREYMSATRGFRDVQDAYQRIKVTDATTPAGQMSLIFQYMKMLDPASTVREGEYANAQNTTGVPGQVLNAYNKALEGQFLTADQVKNFEAQAEQLYRGALSGYTNIRDRYVNDVVPGYPGMDAGRVIPDFAMGGLLPPAAPVAPPKPEAATPLTPEEDAELKQLKQELGIE